MPTPAVAAFGDHVAAHLDRVLGAELVGVWFVGSVALDGYVPGESDVDLAAVCRSVLTDEQRRAVAEALVAASAACPTRGVEFTLYRREVAAAPPVGADFEVNANGGPGMATEIHLDAATQPGFWYVLDRAIAHRAGLAVTGPPAREVFADVPRRTLLDAIGQSMAWHREHEKATLYSVLNACRAWRYVEQDVLGSKLEGAAWARERWPDPGVVDAAVALRHGRPAELTGAAVDALLAHVEAQVRAHA